MFETILIGVDFTPQSDLAVCAGTSFAQRAGAKNLHLVHAIELLPYAYAAPADGVPFMGRWEEVVGEAGRRLAAYPVPETRAKVTRGTRVGSPARELAEEAQDKRADLIVIASHDRSRMGRIVLGSVASTLLRVSTCPVWIVGKDRPGIEPIQHVLAAIDMSPVSSRVLDRAAALAGACHARLTVLSLYELPVFMHERPHLLPLVPAERLEPLEDAYRAKVETLASEVRHDGLEVRVEVMRKAPPANAIRDVAELIGANAIVIGASGHNAWHRFFLGSTATRVATAAPCPVLCVPHSE